jgi:hypothetical protein
VPTARRFTVRLRCAGRRGARPLNCGVVDGRGNGTPETAMTGRRIQHRTQPCSSVRVLASLDGWCLASVGVEAKEVLSVGSTKWTVCYKLHVIPSRRTQYKASITLWPRTRGRRLLHEWHPHLRRDNWYQECRQQLRRYGYRGSWPPSPYGRFGDFWKTLTNFDALAREARLLQRLRRASFVARSRRTSRLTGPA